MSEAISQNQEKVPEASKTETPATTTASTDPAQAPATPEKPAEAPAAPEVQEYEIEVADDSPLSQEDVEEIAKEAERLGLSKEDAQKLVTIREGDYKRGQKAGEDVYTARFQQQRTELLAAPEFATPDKAKESFASIARATKTFGDADLLKALNSPEVGNNLAVARFLKKIGDLIKPDPITGGISIIIDGKAKEKSPEERWYPDMFPKSES